MKKYLTLLLAAVLTFLVGFALHRATGKRSASFRVFPAQPPVAFVPDEENRGQQCRAIYYGMGEGDGVYDPRCYALQAKLSEAAWAGNVERMKDLLRSGARANAVAGTFLYPLQCAARSGRTEAALLLIDNGAEINQHDPITGNALTSAVDAGHPLMVELLLSRGADTNLSMVGPSTLSWAREKKNQEIIDLLERAGASE